MRQSSGFTVIVCFLLVTVFFLPVPVHALENPVLQNLSATSSPGQQDNSPSVSVNSTTPVTIDPVPDHYVGDFFLIHGLADLAAGDTVLIQIQQANPHPGIMIEGNNKSGMSSTAIVRKGKNSLMEWVYPVNMTGWMPGMYDIFVTPVNPRYNVTAIARFNLTVCQTRTTEIPEDHTFSPTTTIRQDHSKTTGLPTRSASIPGAISVLAIGFVTIFWLSRIPP
jgi:hypothetical protein